jgi:2-methylcitrate dehydratase PrpD
MVHVEVRLADGTTLAETVEAPRGSEAKFASAADVTDKFRKLARHAYPDAVVDRIGEMVLACDKLADIGELAAALSRKAG